MNWKRAVYTVVVLFSFVAGYFLIGQLFSKIPAAQAQCVSFKLAGKNGPDVDCCATLPPNQACNWSKINEIQVGPTCGAYGQCNSYMALCIGN